MKLLGIGTAVFLFGTLYSGSGPTEESILIIGGSTDGYLSPCGCTKPMSGGIRRRISAIKALAKGGDAVVIENGGLVSGIGRQDEMKAETLAESFKAAGVSAINVTRSEAALGAPMINALQRLSGGTFITGAVQNPAEPIPSLKAQGPFLIGAATMSSDDVALALGGSPVSADAVAKTLVDEAKLQEKEPVLMLDGSRDQARGLAQKFPALKLIVFRSTGDPPSQPDRAGQTLLITPGERGKHVIRLSFKGDFGEYAAVKLGPDVDDDETAGRAYSRYLSRVSASKLLDQLPRLPSGKYVGSKACASCHTEAYKVWKKTRHAGALKTLEDEKHDRDPDCVACHVVGLEHESGFRDRTSTPNLADVGCESCHGPGKEHSMNPKTKMGKAGIESCLPCHKLEHSPKFDFETYWQKVIHK